MTDPKLSETVPYQYRQKKRVGYKTSDNLIRSIVTEMNQTLSGPQIAFLHGCTRQWVQNLAKKLRREGFKIPYTAPPRVRYTRAWKAIEKFKRYNPDLLTRDNLKSTLIIGDSTYSLDAQETRRLVGYLPKISSVKLPDPQPRFGRIPQAGPPEEDPS